MAQSTLHSPSGDGSGASIVFVILALAPSSISRLEPRCGSTWIPLETKRLHTRRSAASRILRVSSSTAASALQSAHVRECLAELLGTFVMICFGMGVNNQVSLSEETNGTWLSINMAWGIGILMAVYCSEGVSGAHLNPSVTLAHCVYGRLPWWKMPGYVVSQVVGAFVGAAAIYLLDYQKIQKIDPSLDTTQGNFATYPSADISNYTAFYTEALATGMLLLCIYAITDQNNRSPGTVGTPFAFALMIMALGMSFGMNTGYAMNPARDFGPRLLTYCVGYGSKVWTTAHHYFWIPIVAPLVGGVIGAGLYTLLVQMQHPHEHEV